MRAGGVSSFLIFVSGTGRGGSCPGSGGAGNDGAAGTDAFADAGGHGGDSPTATLLLLLLRSSRSRSRSRSSADFHGCCCRYRCRFFGGCFLAWTLDELVELVREGSVARGFVLGYVGAVLVFDAEDEPETTTDDFGEGDEEGDDGAVLGVVREDGVEDPVEAEKRVDDHDGVVDPFGLECGDVSEEGVADVFLE